MYATLPGRRAALAIGNKRCRESSNMKPSVAENTRGSRCAPRSPAVFRLWELEIPTHGPYR
jgi:hypothetical protein